MRKPPRERIVDLAEEAFFRHGVRAVTMDELAEELRMSKKTVYQHFSSKNDLLREVLFRRTGRIDQILKEATAVAYPSFAEKFHAVLHKVAEAVPRPSRRFLRDMKVVVPEVWGELTLERQRVLSAHLGPLFEEGRKEGALREDLESELVLRMFLSMVRDLINPGVLSEFPMSAPQLLELIVSVLTTGVLTPEARGRLNQADPVEASK